VKKTDGGQSTNLQTQRTEEVVVAVREEEVEDREICTEGVLD
jgi:hypothetical protein